MLEEKTWIFIRTFILYEALRIAKNRLDIIPKLNSLNTAYVDTYEKESTEQLKQLRTILRAERTRPLNPRHNIIDSRYTLTLFFANCWLNSSSADTSSDITFGKISGFLSEIFSEAEQESILLLANKFNSIRIIFTDTLAIYRANECVAVMFPNQVIAAEDPVFSAYIIDNFGYDNLDETTFQKL